jgi:acetyl esterase
MGLLTTRPGSTSPTQRRLLGGCRLAVVAVMVAAASIGATTTASATGLGQAPVPTSGQRIEEDVQYGAAGGESLLMDVLVPTGIGPYPAVVMIHGGGFVKGDKSLNRGISEFLAHNGYAVFNINYRLAPAFPYPAAVNDTKTAITFVRDHAQEYSVDPRRVAVFGSSAGGAIAATIGAQGYGTTGTKVMAVVSWSGVMDLPLDYQIRPKNPDVLDGLSGYIGMPGADLSTPEAQQKMAEVSPVNMVKKNAPPMFVANARVEFLPLEVGEEFVGKLKDLGVEHEFLTPPAGHALRYSDQAKEPSLLFLDRWVRNVELPALPGPTTSGSLPPDEAVPAPTSAPFPVVAGVVGAVAIMVGAVVYSRRRLRPRRRAWR